MQSKRKNLSSRPTGQNVTRRNLLKGLGLGAVSIGMGIGLSTVGLQSAKAQSSPSSASETAFYRFKVGDFNLTAISDGVFNFPAPAFGVNAGEGEVADLLDSRHLPTDIAAIPLHCLLIDTGQNLVLIDTGLGPNVFPGDIPNNGKLLPTLKHLGINRNDIDTVILSHGHPDHVGAASDGKDNAKPNFRKARYVMPQTEWDFWTSPPDSEDPFFQFMAGVAAANLPPLEDQIDLISADDIIPRDEIAGHLGNSSFEVVPGISLIHAPGHTLGHVAVMIDAGDDRLLHAMDTAVHYVVGLERPDWHLAADMDPDLAVETRYSILNQASAERIKVFGYHFPFAPLGRVIARGNEAEKQGWDYVPTG